jgi:serine/threonine-protein kinase HipA
MGALEFRPAYRAESVRPTALEMADLIETARQALIINLPEDSQNRSQDLSQNPAIRLASAAEIAHHANHAHHTAAGQSELEQLVAIGTSAGGARAKAVVGFCEQSGDFVSGQFALPEGFEHWIIKFDIESSRAPGRSRAYGRIEYGYYLMALACGIDIQPSRLYEAVGRAHFMTKRFDRSVGNGKLHLQTLCALMGLDFNLRDTHDYHQAFQAAAELGLGYGASDELFRRMVFNVAMANNDDHTKNLSFIMEPSGVWRLAPAYDLTHAFNPHGLWTSRHLLGVNGRFSDIRRGDLLELAHPYHVLAPEEIIDTVLAVADRWPDFAAQANVPEETTAAIANDIAACCRLLR